MPGITIRRPPGGWARPEDLERFARPAQPQRTRKPPATPAGGVTLAPLQDRPPLTAPAPIPIDRLLPRATVASPPVNPRAVMGG